MKDGMQSGVDTPLRNVWDEICVQVQSEFSTMWDFYLDTIEGIIAGHVEREIIPTKQAIWIQTEEGEAWAWEADPADKLPQATEIPGSTLPPGYGENNLIFTREKYEEARKRLLEKLSQPKTIPWNSYEAARYICREYVLPTAEDWHNRRIARYLEVFETLTD
ncbi:MAG: hypothetical protein AAGU11_16550 [Syntrophobacteraceae bacterium]